MTSRLRVKKVGDVCSGQLDVDVQIRSAGTSGHEDAVAAVSALGSQETPSVGRHRSPTVKSTLAGAGYPDWALLSQIEFTVLANERDIVFSTGCAGSDLPFALLGRGVVRCSEVEFGSLRLPAGELPLGDYDEDGDVDLADYLDFSGCFGGASEVAGPACDRFDFDRDGDVDLSDLVAFQAAFTGSR